MHAFNLHESQRKKLLCTYHITILPKSGVIRQISMTRSRACSAMWCPHSDVLIINKHKMRVKNIVETMR